MPDAPADRATSETSETGETGTGDLLQAVARTLRGRFVVALGEHDLTPAQSRALRVVLSHTDGDDGEPPRLSHVAERLRVAPRTATEVVDALEARGLVAREPDVDDRRATRVRPTDAGRALGRVMARTRRAVADDYFATLSPDDRRALRRILTTLEDAER